MPTIGGAPLDESAAASLWQSVREQTHAYFTAAHPLWRLSLPTTTAEAALVGADQLAFWADQLGVGVVRGGEGADPGSIVFDAVESARARGIDLVIVVIDNDATRRSPSMASVVGETA